MLRIIVTVCLSLLPCLVYAADMLLPEDEKYTKAFYTQLDETGWDVELKGKIISISARENLKESDISQKIQDKTRASARLYNNYGINIGDTLYIINPDHLIVGKLTVYSVFKTRALGYLLIGDGNLRLVNIGDTLVSKVDIQAENAYVYKAKGDHSQETGQEGEAISYYQSAIEIDKGNAEAHLSLGYIYLNNDMLEFAANELLEAEKYKKRIYDNEDKFLLYKGLSEVRFKQAYFTRLPDDLRNRYINDGIDFCKEALEIYQGSVEINYYLGVFYYKNKQPLDVNAKEQFLKVISLDQNYIEAYIALAELYERHNNKDRAVSYAEEALKIDPANDRAKFILEKLK